jgi:E3 ubiquitin-protein ligase SHPRH
MRWPGVLVERARLEAEDAQRILLASLNGLAGLFLIEHKAADAIGLYRKVWEPCRPYNACFRP